MLKNQNNLWKSAASRLLFITIEKFAVYPEFEKIIVLSPKQWILHTQDIIQKYIRHPENIVVIEGGATRNETIMNAVKYIEKKPSLGMMIPLLSLTIRSDRL